MKALAKIITGGMIVLSSILPLKKADSQTTKHYFNSDKIEVVENLEKSAVEKQFINPFVPPNDSTLNWYGSGDVNKDNKLDNHDADKLDSLINKTFRDTTDKRLYDRADVNGDEKVTIEDKQTLEDYLNKKISYLPGQWNKLATKEERLDWFKKMIAIDKTDTVRARIIPSNPKLDWKCHEFTLQTLFNLNGYDGYIPSKFDTTNSGRFNLPVHYVWVWNKGFPQSSSSYYHAFNCILVGDNPLNWNDWYFNEPQTDEPIVIGGWNLSKDSSEVKIRSLSDFWEDGSYYPQDFVKFSIKDSIPSLLSYDTNYVKIERDISNSVEEDKHENVVVKNFHLKQNYPNPFNPTTTIRYELPKNEKVTLDVYNILGQKLETLVKEVQQSGQHEIKWDASRYSSGIYFYRIQTKDFVETKKMMFVK